MKLFSFLLSQLVCVSVALEGISLLDASAVSESQCVCTSVPCPTVGKNTLQNGGDALITYYYANHSGFAVVTSAKGTISPKSLDQGTKTTVCTRAYSRTLDDDGAKDCDAGHILANRLGGFGHEPINIFPQDLGVNRGLYAQFEDDIHDCVTSGASSAHLTWHFEYESTKRTMPSRVKYAADFTGGKCTSLSASFDN